MNQRSTSLPLLSCISLMALASACAHHRNPGTAGPPTIGAQVEARVQGTPDEAQVNLAVVTEAKDAAAAAAENARKQADVLATLRALLGEQGKVETSAYNLNPVYDYNEGRQTLRGYVARNELLVRIWDLGKVGPVIDRALSQGSAEVSSLQFRIRNPEPLQQKAIELASQKARAQAMAAADALDVKIAGVYSVTIDTDGTPPVIMASKMMRMEAQAADTPIEAGAVDVRARVSVQLLIAR